MFEKLISSEFWSILQKDTEGKKHSALEKKTFTKSLDNFKITVSKIKEFSILEMMAKTCYNLH